MMRRNLPVFAICASCLFFVAFFGGVDLLIKNGYVGLNTEEWKVSLSSDTKKIVLKGNTLFSIPVTVENQGIAVISSNVPEKPVMLSFHILRLKGDTVVWDNDRTAFAEPLHPNQVKKMFITLNNARLKLNHGDYLVEIDLVRENDFWFKDKGSQALRMPMKVE